MMLFSSGELPVHGAPANSEDPYIWLEDVTGSNALDWVRTQNTISRKQLESEPDFETMRQRILAVLDSKEKIPFVSKYGTYLYNFWRDREHPRGLWRRTTLEEYRKPEPKWETVLDVDALGKAEGENWVWKQATVLKPEYDRCLMHLSRGGADAVVVREFDLVRKEFVKDGFTLPEAKTYLSWRDRDTLYVGTDFGPGSLTKSGYPRIAKEWRRGTPLAEAKTLFEGKVDDVWAYANVERSHGRVYEFFSRGVTFFTDDVRVRAGDDWVRIDKPDDADVNVFGDQLLLQLRSNWTLNGRTYLSGSLLAANFDDYLKGKRELNILFEPKPRESLESFTETKNFLLLTTLENVGMRPYALRFQDGQWTRSALEAPRWDALEISGLDSDESDQYFFTTAGFLTPATLSLDDASQPKREQLKNLPAFFKSENLEVRQFEATSKDGTRIPYFQVSRRDLKLNGENPTLLYGYGGFEIPVLPRYRSDVGMSWLERGYVYVVANIRGGGEFGPEWHHAARKQHRQRAYDDFIAVAEDLIARKVTSPPRLGIRGASNGGLLMGVMLTQRPDLFGAIVCGVPLLDMRRYHYLLAGASWMDEYGDPDKPEEWAYISKFSPYQNVRADKKYPRAFFYTSTRDDRVHPGHARKMVARMKEQGHNVLYYENIEGGHGAAADNKQAAYMEALSYAFLLETLARK